MIEIQIERDELFPLLNQAQGILERKISSPFHAAVLLEAKGASLDFFASGMELSFKGSIPCKVSTPGKAVVSGRKLFDIFREIPSGPVKLKEGENFKLEIIAKGADFHVFGLDPEDFPDFEHQADRKFQKISISSFLDIADKTLYCVSLDESRYHLTGVYCQCFSKKSSYRFASTDGHRMACFDLFLNDFVSFRDKEGDGAIIPKKGFQEIKRMLSPSDDEDGFFELAIEESRAIARFKNQTMFVRLIDGEFPRYDKMIPKKKGESVVINRESFLSALRKVFVLTNDRFKAANFSFKAGKASLEVIVPEEGDGTAVIDCSYKKDEELLVRFNCRYIMESVQALKEDKVQLYIRGKEDGMMLLGHGNKSYISIIMPMSFPKDDSKEYDDEDFPEDGESSDDDRAERADGAPPSMEDVGI